MDSSSEMDLEMNIVCQLVRPGVGDIEVHTGLSKTKSS